MEIIIGRKGNQKTQITDPTVSREHCRVTANGDGTFTIENLSQSGTKVDGRDIIRTTAKLNSRIQLGQSFSATLAELIGAPTQNRQVNVQKMPPETNQTANAQNEQQAKVYNISHLRVVWENYNQANIEIADKQRKVTLIRTGLGIITMCAMPTIFLFGTIGYIFTGLGVIGNIYSFAGMKNAESAEEKQHRQDEFDDAWVCPNPSCRRTLPAKNYKMLVRNYQSCPYCKCKYVEK